MIHNFPYEWEPPLDLAGYNLNGIYFPLGSRADGGVSDGDPSLDEALEKPIGKPALREVARSASGGEVLIIIDDITRNTPLKDLLPAVIRALEEGGVSPGNIRLL